MSTTEPKLKLRGNLSAQILASSLLILGFALALVSLFASFSLRSYLMDEADRTLASSGQIVASQTIESVLRGTTDQVLPTEFYLYVSYGSGNTLEAIYPAVAEEYGTPIDPARLAKITSPEPMTVNGTNRDVQWRIVVVPISDERSGSAIGNVVIGVPLAGVEEAVRALRHVLAVFVIGVLVIGAIASYFILQSSLSGLRRINLVASDVRHGDFSARVPVTDPTTEVGILGLSINAMLEEIEKSFAARAASETAMRQFVSNASHELRTPLATLRGYAELYRMGGVPSEQVGQAFERIESESARMATLVEDLLQLARLDEHREETFKRVDIAATALNTAADFLARSPGRDVTVTDLDGNDIDSVIVVANQDRVTQVMTNLLGNVATHTPEGTSVDILVGINPEDPTTAIVDIRDHGPGISEADRERIFERFYRTDSSRYRGSGGSGLGLAIVAAIMAQHGGSARVFDTPGGGMTVRLTFPVNGQDATSPSAFGAPSTSSTRGAID